VQRFSISVDDELAEWIESQADERGVSKAKVIRDAIETARITGVVQSDAADVIEGKDLLDQIERLEQRVTALEDETSDPTEPEAEKAPEDPVAAFEAQLTDRPPRTEHGEQAVLRVFSILLEEGPMRTNELRERLSPEFTEYYTDPTSMWQSINRHFDGLDGITKVGHGKWDADPSELRTTEE